MRCPRCETETAEAGHYCHACGAGLRESDARRDSWAVQPSESVLQLSFVSTVMPHTSRRAATSYRWAFLALGVITVLLAAFGLLPLALFAAALLVPIVYGAT